MALTSWYDGMDCLVSSVFFQQPPKPQECRVVLPPHPTAAMELAAALAGCGVSRKQCRQLRGELRLEEERWLEEEWVGLVR